MMVHSTDSTNKTSTMNTIKRWGTLLFITIILKACSTAHNVRQAEAAVTNSATDNQLTLNPTPNSLDSAGLIIAVDRRGIRTAIPGGDLGLTKVPGIISIPQVVKTQNMRLGAVAKFLSATSGDSVARVSMYDSAHLNATFSVDQGTYTRLNGSLDSAFETKRSIIERNIRFLNLEQNKIYLILETVSSTNVKIDIDRSNQAGLDALGSLKNWLNLHATADKSTSIKKDIIYQDSKTPVVVLYKLITINIAKGRGNDPSSAVEVSLGNPVTASMIVE